MKGLFSETDILVIGAGAGGLLAALSAKRNSPAGTRVTLVDSWMIGRTGHTAFSNGWTIVALPEDDIDGILREIVAGNDGIADQELVRQTLIDSQDRLRDFEAIGLKFPRNDDGSYARRPTRGLDQARVMHPEGGGLEFCWHLRRALEDDGVLLIDRLFVIGLLKDADGRVTGATGIGSRSGEFYVIAARATIICTNAITFRSGFVRDITGTGTLLALRAGASLRNAEFSYVRPGTPKFYFEGITFAIQEGARWKNARDEAFMPEYDSDWGDEADVPTIARAMALEKRKGNDPLYLDMSPIPEEFRDYFVQSKVKWMDNFFRKLGEEAKTDMFGKTPYFALNQMTKMALRTGPDCRSDVPGLLAAGLAQAGAANHFAGFHIGLCIGNGWIAGKSAVEDLDTAPPPQIDPAQVERLYAQTDGRLKPSAKTESDRLLRDLQQIMFAYDVGILKEAGRLEDAMAKVDSLSARAADLRAPHVHELVRLQETEAMLLAARLILGASLTRTESRLSHIREDYPERDDESWLSWVDIREAPDGVAVDKTPVPLVHCGVEQIARGRPERLRKGTMAAG
ncbi:FAD-binding protein [Pseudoruegeria sp. HB172150]|uniref:FAD-binding protein n=1 Tax=Pseudoruegeria sp. HB172150 TaxID=2721164 RepID=UPI001C12D340|nr:FAD-binding protein [Pseudoruegeria sp. HB172150]